jgi:Uma2 family endonuclease
MLALLTAEQFIEQRYELPDAGQWAELAQGVPVFLQPPDVDHGNVVLNLSKAFATHVQGAGEGYACFDLGLIVKRRPDTVRFPAASYFLTGPRFAEADKEVTDTAPALAIEMASTNDRRKDMTDRVLAYHDFGTPVVWVIDPRQRQVHVCVRGERPGVLEDGETLSGDPTLRGFRISLADLFQAPLW